MNACTTTNVVQGCFNGSPVLIHVTDDGLGKSATRIINVNGDIVVGANATNTVPGQCVLPPRVGLVRSKGTNIAAGTFAASFFPGTVPVATWALASAAEDAQSVTVTATRAALPISGNTVRVNLPTGEIMYLLQGESVTWSVAQDYANVTEVLEDGISVTALGNSAATIAWTVQA